MSFFLRTLPRQTATLTSRQCTRSLTTTPRVQKSAVDSAKDALHSADKTVSQAAVKGIEKGEQAAASMKSTASSTSSEAKGTASEMAGEGKGTMSQMAGEAKGKAHEIKGEVKGKAEEIKGKM